MGPGLRRDPGSGPAGARVGAGWLMLCDSAGQKQDLAPEHAARAASNPATDPVASGADLAT